MKVHRLQFPIEVMSRTLDVSRSGYYAWCHREPSARAQENERLKVAIRVAHRRTRGVYGTRRLQPELAAEGFLAGRERIGRLRKELGLGCKQKRRFKATTNSNHSLPVAPNLLGQDFHATRPGEVWVADITAVATEEGWLYLAGIKDLHSRELVGYAMSARMTQELTGQALYRAVQAHRPPTGLIHHSDRGSQYCAHHYRQLLKQFHMRASMSRRGNCYDNAPMESFWGSLKNELVHHRHFATRAEAEASIREYIEIFYNRQRRHSRLGNVAPAEYVNMYYTQQQ